MQQSEQFLCSRLCCGFSFVSKPSLCICSVYLLILNKPPSQKEVYLQGSLSVLHRTDPAELPLPALEPFHCPQLISAQLQRCFWGHCRAEARPQQKVPFPQLFSCSSQAGRLFPPAASGGSCLSFPRTFSLDPLAVQEFDQCWTFERSIHRKNIGDEGGKPQSGD